MEVYVDDYCTMMQTSDVTQLRQISHALLIAIHDVFPPPPVTEHSGGDPISNKKLLEGEGQWDVRKEILGWILMELGAVLNPHRQIRFHYHRNKNDTASAHHPVQKV